MMSRRAIFPDFFILPMENLTFSRKQTIIKDNPSRQNKIWQKTERRQGMKENLEGTAIFQITDTKLLRLLDKSRTHITIPQGITVIEAKAFAEMEDLEEVIISNTVTTIERRAFSLCGKLKKSPFQNQSQQSA